jgi:hypothetical protein
MIGIVQYAVEDMGYGILGSSGAVSSSCIFAKLVGEGEFCEEARIGPVCGVLSFAENG